MPKLLVDVDKAHSESQSNLEQICNDIAAKLTSAFTEFIDSLEVKLNEINTLLINSVKSQTEYAEKYKKKLAKIMKDLEAFGK